MHRSAYQSAVDFCEKYLADRLREPLTILDVGSFNVNGTLKGLFIGETCHCCTVCGATSVEAIKECCPGPRHQMDMVCDGHSFVERTFRGSKLWRYIGLDCRESCRPHGSTDEHFPLRYNVDRFYDPPEAFPLPDETVDVVTSTSCLEHDPAFWVTFGEMVRVLKPGGLMFLNVPSAGQYHGYPMDCWRFTRDSYKALAMGHPGVVQVLETIEISNSESGGWRDVVGIFRKEFEPQRRMY